MNIYGIIILSTLFIGFLLNLVAEVLNLRRLQPILTGEFADTYDQESYAKSQDYTRVRTKFGFISSTFDLITLLVFWFVGGFPFIDNLSAEIIFKIFPNISQIFHQILTGLVFTGFLIIGNSILSLPFSIYSTFVIEKKFGFNKTTLATFVLDILKGTALGLLIGAPVIALVFLFFIKFGPGAWIYVFITVEIITLIITYIAPTWIMPLFNKFTPLEDGELRNSIFAFAEKVKFPLKNIFVMDSSKRSTKSNAFFTGIGKNKRIALFDTLIEKHTNGELLSVLAHEVGHYKKGHIRTGTIISSIHTFFLLFLLSQFLDSKGLYETFFVNNMSVYTGLVFFGMLYSPIEMILSILMNILSRKNEYEADRFSVENTENPVDMVLALKKLSKDNLSNLTPHPFYVFVNYSHPPVLARINAIIELSKNKPALE